MTTKRQLIKLLGDMPALGNEPLDIGDTLEILVGGNWQRVTLDRTKDKARWWVLRFEDRPTVNVLALGTEARRVVR